MSSSVPAPLARNTKPAIMVCVRGCADEFEINASMAGEIYGRVGLEVPLNIVGYLTVRVQASVFILSPVL